MVNKDNEKDKNNLSCENQDYYKNMVINFLVSYFPKTLRNKFEKIGDNEIKVYLQHGNSIVVKIQPIKENF